MDSLDWNLQIIKASAGAVIVMLLLLLLVLIFIYMQQRNDRERQILFHLKLPCGRVKAGTGKSLKAPARQWSS